MADVTKLLDAAAAGNPRAASELLPHVCDELRKLAAVRLADEKPGQSLQPTALVHEAYLRLVGGQPWDSNGREHFFAAAAEAMRRILINRPRDRHRLKRGGGRTRVALVALAEPATAPDADLLDLHAALDRQLEAALGTPVVWEDREFFLISRPLPDTIERIKRFLAEFRRKHDPGKR
jgi:RNA polymerase sigma factor (TIGR02999 family)